MERIILASASPARKALLEGAGIPIRLHPSGVRETIGRSLRRSVLENARRKASVVSKHYPGRWILAADSLVGFRGRIYGKPVDSEAAVELLSRLAGRTHTLATAVVLQKGRQRLERVVTTRVTFRKLSRPAIRRLVHRYDPTRLAGGYAIRKHRDPLVKEIRGSYTNVVGLPMKELLDMLRKAGLLERGHPNRSPATSSGGSDPTPSDTFPAARGRRHSPRSCP